MDAERGSAVQVQALFLPLGSVALGRWLDTGAVGDPGMVLWLFVVYCGALPQPWRAQGGE